MPDRRPEEPTNTVAMEQRPPEPRRRTSLAEAGYQAIGAIEAFDREHEIASLQRASDALGAALRLVECPAPPSPLGPRAHAFAAGVDPNRGSAFLFCSKCGETRRVEV